MPDSERLEVRDLTVAFAGGPPVVRRVSFVVEPGESMGLVGESGSGKSLTLRAILGLLPGRGRAGGRITYGDRSLLELSPRAFQRLRGSRIGMVFQDPMTALNPVLRVGDAIAQVVAAHEPVGRSQARRRAIESMERVGIRDAARRARAYPHEFSGGMRQRVVIAMALAARPTLLLADEPTTALDVVVQAEILGLLDRLRREDGMSLLLVSHDFGVVAGVCGHVGVMYAGELVERGPTDEVLFRSRHPYTVALIQSLPEAREVQGRLPAIPGAPPEAGDVPDGCPFAPRCPLATVECRSGTIPFVAVAPDQHSRCIHIDRLVEIAPSTQASAELVASGPGDNGG
jgi:oligopeptide/dipeptide ABC transporter ATP-binding protein